jgi:hypothetical protein
MDIYIYYIIYRHSQVSEASASSSAQHAVSSNTRTEEEEVPKGGKTRIFRRKTMENHGLSLMNHTF